MPPADRLPPPPAQPVRSPVVAVKGEEATRVEGLGGGPALEARIHVPPGANRAVVLCHPHPLYGGSMHSPVPLAIAKYLSEVGCGKVAWARFNFRGVGASEGAYDEGRGEVDDACAVLEYVLRAEPGAAVSMCGHSFGSAVALSVAVRDSRIDRALLIAPSTRLFNLPRLGDRLSARTTIFIGDRDELCDVGDARNLANELGAELRVFEGFDHHFLKSRRALAEAALPVIAPEVAPQ
jgi:alpha/beta superfamily hydrolase